MKRLTKTQKLLLLLAVVACLTGCAVNRQPDTYPLALYEGMIGI